MGRARAWKLIAFAPVLVVLYANAMFVRNHFYVRGPYFHDSGWFSQTVFHAGIIPRNPSTSFPMIYYWGWHVTGIVSVGSMLSYAFPGDRVDWYCIFQALIYAPLAFAIPVLVPPEARAGWRSALLVAACSLAFVFSGQVVSCMAYPHFEIFASAGIALMLAALAMGRERLAWVGLAMAIGTREDCGFHAASFLVAVLAADVFGRPFPMARRRVLLMAAVGLMATALMIAMQKKLFVSVDAFKIYITGTPPYAHLTGPALVERVVNFGTKCGFIWLAILATGLVAIVRRDARYLLGWVVTLPWLVLNFTAHQDIKAALTVYTGFPFVGSIFWVAAYARVEEARSARRSWRSPLLAGAFVSVASTLGMLVSFPVPTVATLGSAFLPATRNPEGLRAFARGLRAREYGAVKVDPSMNSWAVESVTLEDLVSAKELEDGIVTGDGYAFFFFGAAAIDLLARSPFPKCGHVPETPAFLCTRANGSLPPTVTPSSPLLQLVQLSPEHVRRADETVVVDARPAAGIATFGPYLRLRADAYTVSWDLAFGTCEPGATSPSVHVDVLRDGKTLLAERDLTPADASAVLAFDVPTSLADKPLEFRTWWGGSCPFVVRGIDVRRVHP